METVKNQVIESGVKVGNIEHYQIQKIPAFIQRKMSCQGIADDMTSRITGKLIGFPDLYDPKTNTFLTEDELIAKGAVFMTVNYRKELGVNDTVKKGRINGLPTPTIVKTSKFQIIANIDWQSYINRRSEHGQFIASEIRSNGVENYENCKAIGKTQKGDFTLNGVAFKVLEETRYFDENGKEFDDVETLKKEYLKVASKESKEKEAEKHGIAVEFDPQYRTVRIDSCESIRAFGFEYIPLFVL